MSEAVGTDTGTEAGTITGSQAGSEVERLYIYPLPRYHEDGRFDPRARGELEVALPHTDAYATKLRSIAKPGWYAVELRRGNKIADSWVVEVRPIERAIDSEPSTRASAPAAPPAPAAAVDIAALIESALERQREMFVDELEAVREELAQSKVKDDAPETVGSRLAARLEQMALDRMEKTLSGEDVREEKPSSNLSDEDELALRLLRGTDLLPKVVERITRTLGSGDEPTPRRGVGDRLLDTFEGNPVLQSKAARAAERVLNRFFPEPAGDDDDDDDDDDSDGDDANAIANECADYLMEKCAANAPVSFSDAPIKRLADNLPDVWGMIIHSLQTSSIDTFIIHFSNPESWPTWYASVLQAPHARRWITKNLAEPAKQLIKK
jgi:hypothetical protein